MSPRESLMGAALRVAGKGMQIFSPCGDKHGPLHFQHLVSQGDMSHLLVLTRSCPDASHLAPLVLTELPWPSRLVLFHRQEAH